MNNIVDKKRFIVFIAIIILILIFLIILLLKANSNSNKKFGDDPEPEEAIEYNNQVKYKLRKIDNITEYYTVKTIINKYYLYYARVFGGDMDDMLLDEKIDYAEVLLSLYSRDYISQNGLTTENLKEKLPEIKDKKVELYETYYIYDLERIKVFFVRGKLVDNETKNTSDFELKVIEDMENQTFEIIPEDIDFESMKVNEETGFDFNINIDNRKYNIFENAKVSYDDYAKDLFERVRNMMLYDRETAYGLLDNSPSNLFKSYDELNEYVTNNYQKIYLLTYSGYTNSMNNGNLEYICYDTNTEYRIVFHLKSIMEFTYSIEKIK